MRSLLLILIFTGSQKLYSQEARYAECVLINPNPHKEDITFLKASCERLRLCGENIECISGLVKIPKYNTNHMLFKRIGPNISAYTDFNGKIHNVPDSCEFRGVAFKAADFSSVIFRKNVIFINSFFDVETVFFGSNFYENASFINKNQFNKYTDFGEILFMSNANFESSIFNESVNFKGIKVEENVLYKNCKFKKNVFFDQIRIGKNASFYNAEFGENVSFIKAEFGNIASFRYSIFKTVPSFDRAELPDTLDFRDLKLDFKDNPIDSQEDDKIDLSSTSVAKLRARSGDKYNKCKLLLQSEDIDRYLIPYDRIAIIFDSTFTYEQKTRTYEILIKSCQEAGMIESAKGWNIDYQKMITSHFNPYMGGFLNLFYEYWSNFGYNKTMRLCGFLQYLSYFLLLTFVQ